MTTEQLNDQDRFNEESLNNHIKEHGRTKEYLTSMYGNTNNIAKANYSYVEELDFYFTDSQIIPVRKYYELKRFKEHLLTNDSLETKLNQLYPDVLTEQLYEDKDESFIFKVHIFITNKKCTIEVKEFICKKGVKMYSAYEIGEKITASGLRKIYKDKILIIDTSLNSYNTRIISYYTWCFAYQLAEATKLLEDRVKSDLTAMETQLGQLKSQFTNYSKNKENHEDRS